RHLLAMKSFLQFVFSLAILCLFMYPRMWPLIRRSIRTSRAAKTPALARPVAGSGQGTVQRERIVSFVSDVSLRKNTTLAVREEFTVHSEGKYFKWGMIRDLP